MTKYIIRRLLQAIPTVLGVTLLVFFLISLAPGGPVEILAFNNRMKPGEKEELKLILGYSDPLLVQYLRWLTGDDWMRWDSDGDGQADASVFFVDLYAPKLDEWGKPIVNEATGEAVMRRLPPGKKRGILRGDWGNSVYYKRSALSVLVERLPATLELGITSLITGFTIGIAVGIVAAVYHGGCLRSSQSRRRGHRRLRAQLRAGTDAAANLRRALEYPAPWRTLQNHA